MQLKYKTKPLDISFKIPTEGPVKENHRILTAAHSHEVSDFQNPWIMKAPVCGEGCVEDA